MTAPTPGELDIEDRELRSLDYVSIPRLFDGEASDRAWKIWLERGHGEMSFVMCINAYVEEAAALSKDRRSGPTNTPVNRER